MSFQIRNLRKRLTDVEYEIRKQKDEILFLQENLEARLKQKDEMTKHNVKWESAYQLGLEQTELQIKIIEATVDKYTNETMFLRIQIEEEKEKLNKQ